MCLHWSLVLIPSQSRKKRSLFFQQTISDLCGLKDLFTNKRHENGFVSSAELLFIVMSHVFHTLESLGHSNG